ncbi:unnamed protein product [Aureobasidium uvarum]|uniref:Histidine-specific methyltransferase SAM-dependent domain-containing protein n=1 Tax=Aureobasidium uvarum TaxID=2773716 RepID=A0A9N8KVT3_9PEZI|nr:unnamed protein product [Aureobasidium uvarum]
MDTPQEMPAKKIEVDLKDIRSSTHNNSLLKELEESLSKNPPAFPSRLLWDDKGLQYFEAITHSPDYYLTNCEIELLTEHSREIAKDIYPNTIIMELGSGSLRKTKILLDALEALEKPVDYCALDLSRPELERTLTNISPSSFQHVKCHGSTIGSLSRPEAAQLLGGYVDAIADVEAMKSSPHNAIFLVGVDGCKDADMVWRAYNDTEGYNHRFISNILHHANKVLDIEAYHSEDWTVAGVWSAEKGCHDQFLMPERNLFASGLELKKGRGLHVVSSHKFDEDDQDKLWEGAGLQLSSCWRTEPHKYTLNLLTVGDVLTPLKKLALDDIRDGIRHAP